MELVFATNNEHKLHEISNIFNKEFKILSLSDIGFFEEIPETANTLKGNASLKAFHIYKKFKKNCFADDTGLEVEALNGNPGVFSSRYAGPECLSENNIKKLLFELRGVNNRNARFRTVISLIINGKEKIFEGIAKGHISLQIRGANGFGYDPVFIPDNYEKSFAQLDIAEKNKISHRGKAFKKLMNYFN